MAVTEEPSRTQSPPANVAELRAEFDRVGAVIVRGVLSRDEVAELRDSAHALFAPFDARPDMPYVRSLSAATLFRRPELLLAAMRPRIVAALSAILEPRYAVEPDLQIQRNSFPLVGPRSPLKLFGLIGPGWHNDSGDERINSYLFDDDYRMVKCGLYLQDNSDALGGSIDIAPSGHRRFFLTGNPKIDYYLQRARQNVCIVTRWRSLDIKAGDFVAFDSWLPHRGTIPRGYLKASETERRRSYVALPPDKSKFAIYYNASRRRFAHTYIEHCLKRGREELRMAQGGAGNPLFFADFPGLRYPQDYPPALVALIERNGLQMCQLKGDDLAAAVELRQRALSSGLFQDCMPVVQ